MQYTPACQPLIDAVRQHIPSAATEAAQAASAAAAAVAAAAVKAPVQIVIEDPALDATRAKQIAARLLNVASEMEKDLQYEQSVTLKAHEKRHVFSKAVNDFRANTSAYAKEAKVLQVRSYTHIYVHTYTAYIRGLSPHLISSPLA